MPKGVSTHLLRQGLAFAPANDLLVSMSVSVACPGHSTVHRDTAYTWAIPLFGLCACSLELIQRRRKMFREGVQKGALALPSTCYEI